MKAAQKRLYEHNIRDCKMKAIGLKSAKLVLDELGYEIDTNLDSHYTEKGAMVKSVGIREKDTKLSFANVNARRDDNFKALQEFRISTFAYTETRIIYF